MKRIEDFQYELGSELASLHTKASNSDEKHNAYEAELERIRTRIELEPGPLMANLSNLPKASSRMDSDKQLHSRGGRRGDSSFGFGTQNSRSGNTSEAKMRMERQSNIRLGRESFGQSDK